MRHPDELHTEYLFDGSRQLARHLRRESVTAGQHRIRRLMHRMEPKRRFAGRGPVSWALNAESSPIGSGVSRSHGSTTCGARTTPMFLSAAGSCTSWR